MSNRKGGIELSMTAFIILMVFVVAGGSCYVYPRWDVWREALANTSEYARAEQNRRLLLLEAESKRDAAKALADAEIERAKGVAEANKIIGASLVGNEAYLRYFWIHGVQSSNADRIYIPTEAGFPILEERR